MARLPLRPLVSSAAAVLRCRALKSPAKLSLLVALLVLLPLSHLDIERSEGGWLLRVDGRPVDLAGELSERYTRLTRDCRPVQDLAAQDPMRAAVTQAIAQYSPPDSLSARLVQVSHQGPWYLAQVKFDHLQDAVVLLTRSPQGLAIAEDAVWSASTFPHKPEPVIRRYLQAKAPAAPRALIDCFAHPL